MSNPLQGLERNLIWV